jgi:hypothetical protein
MAKRLNKQMVLALTIAGMVVTTAAGVLLIVNLPKKDPQPLVDQAELFAERGEYEEAMRYYNQASIRARTAGDAEKTNAYLVRAGDMALKCGLAAEARRFWGAVVLNNPAHEEAQERIVELSLEFAKPTRNVRNWQEVQNQAGILLEINPNNYLGLHAMGRALIGQRAINESFMEEGKAKLIAAVEGDKSNPEYVNDLALLVYLAERKIEDALRVYNVLIEDNPSEDPAVLAKAYRYRGQFLLGINEPDALRLRAVLKAGGGQNTGALRSAVVEREEKALADLQKAAELAPEDAECLIALGAYWQTKASYAADEATRQNEEADFRQHAEALYKRAVAAAPDDFEAYVQLARLHSTHGQYDEALQVIEARIHRGYERRHYRAWLDAVFMSLLREEAFRIRLAQLRLLAEKVSDRDEFLKQRQPLMAELNDLYNQTVADTSLGEDDPRALYMQARLLMIEGNGPEGCRAASEGRHVVSRSGRRSQTPARLHPSTGESAGFGTGGA